MKKCIFVIPYFGKLPNYFQLFLNSCTTNRNYDWLLLTDDSTTFDYPSNVKRVLTDFNSIVQLFSRKLEMDAALSKPYKLCDFKPAYGYLFSEYLSDYRFWGHCDIDTILGDLDAFITDELLESYDKLFCLGHLIIYRNTPEINRVFMTDGYYLRIFSYPEYVGFDEMPPRDEITIDQLFEKCQLRIYKESLLMDVYVYGTWFRRIKYLHQTDSFELEKKRKALYVWQNGKLKRYYIGDDKTMKTEEFLYIHLQKREMKMLMENVKMTSFKIVPNAFMQISNEPVNIQTYRKEQKILLGGRMLQFFIDQYITTAAGFIYAIRKRINPFTVEAVQCKKMKWRPSQWYSWIRFVPRTNP